EQQAGGEGQEQDRGRRARRKHAGDALRDLDAAPGRTGQRSGARTTRKARRGCGGGDSMDECATVETSHHGHSRSDGARRQSTATMTSLGLITAEASWPLGNLISSPASLLTSALTDWPPR